MNNARWISGGRYRIVEHVQIVIGNLIWSTEKLVQEVTLRVWLLTEGHPALRQVVSVASTETELLMLAAAVEAGSEHPLAPGRCGMPSIVPLRRRQPTRDRLPPNGIA